MTREEAASIIEDRVRVTEYVESSYVDCVDIEALNMAISALTEQRWIPCSERLPEPRKAVLGYAPRYQNIYALYYDSAYGWMIWNPLRDDCFPNSQGEIVAWMPLPEPYREGLEDERSN
jgi:hypothetical protein